MTTGKMRVVLVAGGMFMSIFTGFRSLGYNYVQPEKPCGVKKAGSTVTLTVSVPGTIISGDILNADTLSWKRIDASDYTCTILPADTPGAHTGTFEGKYVKNGGGSGSGESTPLTWFASAKTTVVTLSGSLTGTARPAGEWDIVDIVISATGSPSGLGGITGSFGFSKGITTTPATPIPLASSTNVLNYTGTFNSNQNVIGEYINSSLTYGGLTFSASGVFAGAGAAGATFN